MVIKNIQRVGAAYTSFLTRAAGLSGLAAVFALALSACQQPTASDLNAVTGTSGVTSTTTIVPASTKAGAPDIISVVSGNAQTAINGSQLSNQLTVRVTDISGNPVPGVLVTFTSATGGGIVQTSATVFSDVSGLASATVILGSPVGTQTFTASMSSGTVPTVTFTEISTAVASLVKIYPLIGTTSVGTTSLLIGDTFTMRAVLVSSSGAFIKEIPATWWMTGTLTTANLAITGGNPSKYATLSPTATGTGTINALVDDLTLIGDNNITSTTTVTGTITVSLALTPDSISIVSGNSQSGQVGTNLAQNLVVKVVNAGGTPVPGVDVTFAVASGGGQIVSVQPVATDINGLATCIVKLGGVVGTGHSFTATMASGSTKQVLFSATGTHGPAAQLSFYQQPGGANSGTAFATQPIVEVRDQYGNRVTSDSSSTVTLSVNTGTGALSGTLTANVSSGRATFTNVSYSVGENGVILNAASSIGGVSSATSGAFDVGTIIAAAQCAVEGVGWQTIDGGCKDLTSGLVWSASTRAVGVSDMTWYNAVWDSTTSGSPSPEAWQVARGITKDIGGSGIPDASAAAYCQNLVESGLSDWRMASIGEWQGADQHGAYSNLKNGNFGVWQWSGSIYSTSYSYQYNFVAGATGSNWNNSAPTGVYPTRCVRQPAPTKLLEVTAVAGGTAGLGVNVAFNTQPVVRLADGTNSTVTYSNAAVTLAVASGPVGGQLCIHNKQTARLYDCSDSKTVSAVSGAASFNNLGGTNTGLAVSAAGTYTLTASSAGLSSATLTNFTVNQIYPKALCASLGNVWVNGEGGCKDTTTGLIFSSVSPTTMNWYDAVWDSSSYTCTATDNTNTNCSVRRAPRVTDNGYTSDYGFMQTAVSATSYNPGVSPDASSVDYCHDLQESGYTDWIVPAYSYGNSDTMRSFGDYYYMTVAGKAPDTYTKLGSIGGTGHWTTRGNNTNETAPATAILSWNTGASWYNKLSINSYVYCVRREAPAAISIIQQPADSAGYGAGQPFQIQPILHIKDSSGHGPLTYDKTAITLDVVAASDGTGGTGKLIRYSSYVPWSRTVLFETESVTLNASHGVLDFTNTPLAYNKPGEKFRIKITAAGTWQGNAYTLPAVYTNDITVPVIYAPAACTSTFGGLWASQGGGCKRDAGTVVYSHQLFDYSYNNASIGGYYGSTYWEKMVWDSTRGGAAPDAYDLGAVDDYDTANLPTTYFDADPDDLCHRLILNGYRDWRMPRYTEVNADIGTKGLFTAIPKMSQYGYLVLSSMNGTSFYMGFHGDTAWSGWYTNMFYTITKGYCVRTIKGGGDPFQY